MKPADYSAAQAVQLEKKFGGADAVPTEFKSKWFMIHMRMQEAEQEIVRRMRRLAEHIGQVPTSIVGEGTGDF